MLDESHEKIDSKYKNINDRNKPIHSKTILHNFMNNIQEKYQNERSNLTQVNSGIFEKNNEIQNSFKVRKDKKVNLPIAVLKHKAFKKSNSLDCSLNENSLDDVSEQKDFAKRFYDLKKICTKNVVNTIKNKEDLINDNYNPNKEKFLNANLKENHLNNDLKFFEGKTNTLKESIANKLKKSQNLNKTSKSIKTNSFINDFQKSFKENNNSDYDVFSSPNNDESLYSNINQNNYINNNSSYMSNNIEKNSSPGKQIKRLRIISRKMKDYGSLQQKPGAGLQEAKYEQDFKNEFEKNCSQDQDTIPTKSKNDLSLNLTENIKLYDSTSNINVFYNYKKEQLNCNNDQLQTIKQQTPLNLYTVIENKKPEQSPDETNKSLNDKEEIFNDKKSNNIFNYNKNIQKDDSQKYIQIPIKDLNQNYWQTINEKYPKTTKYLDNSDCDVLNKDYSGTNSPRENNQQYNYQNVKTNISKEENNINDQQQVYLEKIDPKDENVDLDFQKTIDNNKAKASNCQDNQCDMLTFEDYEYLTINKSVNLAQNLSNIISVKETPKIDIPANVANKNNVSPIPNILSNMVTSATPINKNHSGVGISDLEKNISSFKNISKNYEQEFILMSPNYNVDSPKTNVTPTNFNMDGRFVENSNNFEKFVNPEKFSNEPKNLLQKDKSFDSVRSLQENKKTEVDLPKIVETEQTQEYYNNKVLCEELIKNIELTDNFIKHKSIPYSHEIFDEKSINTKKIHINKKSPTKNKLLNGQNYSLVNNKSNSKLLDNSASSVTEKNNNFKAKNLKKRKDVNSLCNLKFPNYSLIEKETAQAKKKVSNNSKNIRANPNESAVKVFNQKLVSKRVVQPYLKEVENSLDLQNKNLKKNNTANFEKEKTGFVSYNYKKIPREKKEQTSHFIDDSINNTKTHPVKSKYLKLSKKTYNNIQTIESTRSNNASKKLRNTIKNTNFNMNSNSQLTNNFLYDSYNKNPSKASGLNIKTSMKSSGSYDETNDIYKPSPEIKKVKNDNTVQLQNLKNFYQTGKNSLDNSQDSQRILFNKSTEKAPQNLSNSPSVRQSFNSLNKNIYNKSSGKVLDSAKNQENHYDANKMNEQLVSEFQSNEKMIEEKFGIFSRNDSNLNSEKQTKVYKNDFDVHKKSKEDIRSHFNNNLLGSNTNEINSSGNDFDSDRKILPNEKYCVSARVFENHRNLVNNVSLKMQANAKSFCRDKKNEKQNNFNDRSMESEKSSDKNAYQKNQLNLKNSFQKIPNSVRTEKKGIIPINKSSKSILIKKSVIDNSDQTSHPENYNKYKEIRQNEQFEKVDQHENKSPKRAFFNNANFENEIRKLNSGSKKLQTNLNTVDIKELQSKIRASSNETLNNIHYDLANKNITLNLTGKEELEAKKTASSYQTDNFDGIKVSAELKNFYRTNKDINSRFKTHLDCYNIIKCIGKGSFGKVHLGQQVLTKKLVAIKAIDKQMFMQDERSRKKIENEVQLFKESSGCSRVIRLLEVFESKQYIFFVMENAINGDLLNFLKQNGKMQEFEAKKALNDIIIGLKHLHSINIVHRDIKLDNILLDSNNNGKIADFGISKKVPQHDYIFEQCGTPAYLAPEIIRNKGYDGYISDIWSLGVLLHALTVGTVPFKAETLEDLYRKIQAGNQSMLNDFEQSDELKDLLIKMLNINPFNRISAAEIQNHPWQEELQPDTEVLQTRSIRETNKKPIRNKDISPYIENKRINLITLRVMELLGFPIYHVLYSLNKKKHNHATACYYLINSY